MDNIVSAYWESRYEKLLFWEFSTGYQVCRNFYENWEKPRMHYHHNIGVRNPKRVVHTNENGLKSFSKIKEELFGISSKSKL